MPTIVRPPARRAPQAADELFMGEGHREAMAHLVYGVRGGGGFVVLTGGPGTGKTATVQAFVRQLPAHCRVACIAEPRQGVDEMLRSVCREFALVQLPPRASRRLCIEALNAFLLRGHAQGRQALLIVDDAHLLPDEVLEQLRLLTNLETAERKLLQIFLVGRPGLSETLAQPAFEQLAQRVVARHHLGGLGRGETAAYVAHRLARVGAAGRRFDGAALAALHRHSRGVPGELDRLVERVLHEAGGPPEALLERAAVRRAARGLLHERGPAGRWWFPRPVWPLFGPGRRVDDETGPLRAAPATTPSEGVGQRPKERPANDRALVEPKK